MGNTWSDLNRRRAASYAKDEGEEAFFRRMNEALRPNEEALYGDDRVAHPFLFVFGAPRSGTTLMSQALAYALDVGYINNLAARFWLTPLHGVKLAKSVLGTGASPRFESNYARTSDVRGIHEFGYFWSHWLRQRSPADVARAPENEASIDWDGLRRVLANVQAEFDRPFAAKNIYGSYHIERLSQVLGKVLWIWIRRDPLNTAVSILDARRRYYGDESNWWSYAPPEYAALTAMAPREQIAGQIACLANYYERETAKAPASSVIRVRYSNLCADPAGVLDTVRQRAEALYGCPIAYRDPPPTPFAERTYDDRAGDRDRFRSAFEAACSKLNVPNPLETP